MYIGGNFTNLNGVTNANTFCYYDFASSTFVSLDNTTGVFTILKSGEYLLTMSCYLKASSGNWYLPKSLKVKQLDPLQNVFDFENTLVLGELSGATAVVNKVQKIMLGGYEIYELLLDTNSITNYFYPNEKITAFKSVLLNNVIELVRNVPDLASSFVNGYIAFSVSLNLNV
jgi:hypothetical protein